MRIIKVLAIILGSLILLMVIGVYYGLSKFKNFPEYDVTLETIKSDTSELTNHIEKIVSFGLRNPGSEGDKRARNYILKKFSEYGLDTRAPDTFDIKTYHPTSWNLSLSNSATKSSIDVPTFSMPFTASTDSAGLTAPMIYVGDGENLKDQDLNGKIAVYEMKFKPKGIKTYSKILYMYESDNFIK